MLLSVSAVRGRDPSGLAGELLSVMAVLAAAGVPGALIHGLTDGTDDGSDRNLAQAVQACMDASLLSRATTGDALLMHRLLARVIRESDHAAGRAPEIVAVASGLLEAQVPSDQTAWVQRAWGAELVLQVQALWETLRSPGADDLTTRVLGLRIWAVRQLILASDLARAVQVGKQTIADCERVLGPTTPTPWPRGTTSPAPTHRRGIWPRRSRCTRRPSPTASACSAPTTPTPWPRGTTSPTPTPAAGRHGAGDPAVRATTGRPRAGAGPRPPRHPDIAAQPRRRLRGGRDAGRRRSRCYEPASPTRSGCWAPTTPTPCLAATTSPCAYQWRGTWRGRSAAVRAAPSPTGERVLGPDHPDTLTSRNNLAAPTGRRAGPRRRSRCYERTLADRERVLGPDHPDTLTSRNNLAGAYRAAGRAAEAIPLHERTLADCERVLGPDHPDTLTSRNNLADAYRAGGPGRRGDPAATSGPWPTASGSWARTTPTPWPPGTTSPSPTGPRAGPPRRSRCYERTLADRERVLGPDHPDTLTSRNNLAAAYRAAGRAAEAIPLYERTLADRERVLGPDHPDTLTSRNNLAAAYEAAGDPPARSRCTSSPWPTGAGAGPRPPRHPAPAQQPRRRLRGGGGPGRRRSRCTSRPLADRERVLGPDHPDTLISRNNLAYAYRRRGIWAERSPCTSRPSPTASGCSAPTTPAPWTRGTTSPRLPSHGDLARAIPLYEATLADSERALGPDHPATLGSRNNLAGAYEAWATWAERSRCTRLPWPTGSGCWAPTTRAPSPSVTRSSVSRATAEAEPAEQAEQHPETARRRGYADDGVRHNSLPSGPRSKLRSSGVSPKCSRNSVIRMSSSINVSPSWSISSSESRRRPSVGSPASP